MTHKMMLNVIYSYGYGVYTIPNPRYNKTSLIVVADPQDGPDGFRLIVPTVTEAYREMVDAELIYCRP